MRAPLLLLVTVFFCFNQAICQSKSISVSIDPIEFNMESNTLRKEIQIHTLEQEIRICNLEEKETYEISVYQDDGFPVFLMQPKTGSLKTTIEFKVNHEGHADFTSGEVKIVVQ